MGFAFGPWNIASLLVNAIMSTSERYSTDWHSKVLESVDFEGCGRCKICNAIHGRTDNLARRADIRLNSYFMV